MTEQTQLQSRMSREEIDKVFRIIERDNYFYRSGRTGINYILPIHNVANVDETGVEIHYDRHVEQALIAESFRLICDANEIPYRIIEREKGASEYLSSVSESLDKIAKFLKSQR